MPVSPGPAFTPAAAAGSWETTPTSPPAYTLPPPSQGLPAWLVTALVALVLIGGGALGLYVYKGGGLSASNRGAEENTKLLSPEEAAKSGRTNPYAKYIEITGIRILETPKKQLEVRLAVVNHSLAQLPDLTLNVRLRSTKASPGEAPIAAFNVKVPSMAPLETRDVKTITTTRYRAYELPDWQFLTADFNVEK
ncbi:MAG: hypothetical protein NZV14_02035 [Bryobacteraceae bacterium]|nr:hypothetical protein [Bryobacteraceae bacterium]MDW8376909.1 hypothetical protein [Bryobacterales bacterium]